MFNCTKCEYTSYKRHNVERHELTHLRKRVLKYSCYICGNAFGFLSSVRRHMKTLHPLDGECKKSNIISKQAHVPSSITIEDEYSDVDYIEMSPEYLVPEEEEIVSPENSPSKYNYETSSELPTADIKQELNELDVGDQKSDASDISVDTSKCQIIELKQIDLDHELNAESIQSCAIVNNVNDDIGCKQDINDISGYQQIMPENLWDSDVIIDTYIIKNSEPYILDPKNSMTADYVDTVTENTAQQVNEESTIKKKNKLKFKPKSSIPSVVS